jgi:hypothetical protein
LNSVNEAFHCGLNTGAHRIGIRLN